jgi:hypothetical protein
MSSKVELKVEVVASKGFVEAVQRLANCRTLALKDHAAVLRLCKCVQKTVAELQQVSLKGEDELFTSKLSESVSLEGCTLSAGVIDKAGLSPQNTLALEGFIEGLD